MLGYFLKLCWKNVWRNRRRTLLSVGAIGFSVMALVAIRNYYDAFHEQIIHNVIRYQSGHVQITAPGYPDRNAPTVFIAEPQPVFEWLEARPEIHAWAERVQVQGLISSAHGSANMVFVGVQPEREKDVTQYSRNVAEGAFLEAGDSRGIVLGEGLAQLLDVGTGSKVVALTQGIDGSIGNELFVVRGVFRTQSDADRSVAFVTIDDARALASLPPTAVHQVSVLLHRDRDATPVRDAFAATFAAQPAKVAAMTWMEVQKHVMAIIELDNAVNRLLMFIIVSVASLGIANAILMSIMERKRELGVMMTVGALKREIVGMVMTETVLIAAVGLAVGNLLGVAVTLIFGQTGFDLAWLTSQRLEVGGSIVQTVSYPAVVWQNSAAVTVVVFLLALAAAIIPARHIAGLQVVKALRPG